MKTRNFAVVGALMVSLSAGPANAGLITFDFTGGGSNGTSVAQTVDNVKLTVTADKTHRGSGPFTVTWNKNGLGVERRPDGGKLGADELSAQAVREELIFTFEVLTGVQQLELVSVDFFNFNGGDRMRLFVDDTRVGTNLKPGDTTNGTWIVSNTIADPLSVTATSSFGFRAQNVNGGNGFRIASVTFRVPEPATMALLAPALVGIGFQRRRAASR